MFNTNIIRNYSTTYLRVRQLSYEFDDLFMFLQQTGGKVSQHHTGGGFIDVLAAMAAGPDEALLHVGFRHAHGLHAPKELGLPVREVVWFVVHAFPYFGWRTL